MVKMQVVDSNNVKDCLSDLNHGKDAHVCFRPKLRSVCLNQTVVKMHVFDSNNSKDELVWFKSW